jgi:hypothetical protein
MHPPRTASRGHRPVRFALASILIGLVGLIGVGPAGTTSASPADRQGARPTIVLVHGSFADASGFNDVIKRPQARGYPTIAPSNPLRSLAGDAAYIRSVSTASTDRSSSSLIPTAAW